MFERYTEKARRVIFFARYEAAQGGSPYIEAEHLLLAFCREHRWLMYRLSVSPEAATKLEQKLRDLPARGDTTSTSVDIPLSNESKRVLAYSAEEAERLSHRHIGAEHLLLGLLRETGCEASRALMEAGLEVERARVIISEFGEQGAQEIPMGSVTGLQRTSLQLVDNTTGVSLGQWPLQPLVPLPRTGERVLLHSPDSGPKTYRVVDVSYEVSSGRLEIVQLRLEALSQSPDANTP